jgi:hypothetical protein
MFLLVLLATPHHQAAAAVISPTIKLQKAPTEREQNDFIHNSAELARSSSRVKPASSSFSATSGWPQQQRLRWKLQSEQASFMFNMLTTAEPSVSSKHHERDEAHSQGLRLIQGGVGRR